MAGGGTGKRCWAGVGVVAALLFCLRVPAVAAERHIAAAAGHICMVQEGGGVVCNVPLSRHQIGRAHV